ncbi:MAG: methylated-DNA--[protein]-cysteine S-methyltransferase [Azospirillaceae bacterium]
MPARTTIRFLDTPVGRMRLAAMDGRLAECGWAEADEVIPAASVSDAANHAVLERAATQLEAYFAGGRRDFDLPLARPATLHAGKVRAAMQAIPYGGAASYGDLARAIDGVARAVGQACRHNPLAIIVPCHRVLGSGRGLGGFAGSTDPGGPELARKRWLLAHERRVAGESLPLWSAGRDGAGATVPNR